MTETTAGTATLVKGRLKGFTGSAGLYRLHPPLQGNIHVVVSAAEGMFSGPETYIFPANADGSVTDWGELQGSCRGTLDHEEALNRAGYVIAPEPNNEAA